MNNTSYLNAIQFSPVTSTAAFNQAYVEADAVYENEVRLANGKKKGTKMNKLLWRMRKGYQDEISTIFANRLYTCSSRVEAMAEISRLMDIWKFHDDASRLMQSRMAWSSLMELPLIDIKDDGQSVLVYDRERLAGILKNDEDYNQFLVAASSLRADELLAPLREVAGLHPETWADIVERVRARAGQRIEAKKGSKTDRIIMRQENLSTYMLTHICNRYLGTVLRSLEFVQRQTEYMVERMDKAIREADGREAQHRDYKVSGYSDLSRNEKGGYCDPTQVEHIRQQYMEGFNDNEGITALKERAEGLVDLEKVLLETSIEASETCREARLDVPQWAYTWKKLSEDDFIPITDREEALALIRKEATERREKNKKTFIQQKLDEGRYYASTMKVSTIELGMEDLV